MTKTEAAEIIIENGSCFGVRELACFMCPFADKCNGSFDSLAVAKQWLKDHPREQLLGDRIKEAINSTEFVDKVAEAVIGKINEPVKHEQSIFTGTIVKGVHNSIDGYSITIHLDKYVPFKLNERVSISTEESK